MSKQEEQSDAVPKYGAIGNGEYLTPFNMTVIYHDKSMFETAVAFLTARAQVIPLASNVDYETVADSCEYLTPEVIIFGMDFPKTAIEKFFARGFKFVHVFTYDPTDITRNKYMDGDTSTYDIPMIVFDITTLHDHIVILEGLTPMTALEHIINGCFNRQTNSDGVYFCQYLLSTGKHIGKELLRLSSSFRGFGEIDTMITRGKYMDELYENMARVRIDTAHDDMFANTRVLTIYGGDLRNEMMALLPVHPRVVRDGVKFALFYEREAVPDTTHVVDTDECTVSQWKITVVGVGKDAPSALEFLRGFSPNPVGSFNTAYAYRTDGAFPLGVASSPDKFVD